MKRAWTKISHERLAKLFEGYFSLNVVHSDTYEGMGHGSGSNAEFAFWAVRASKNNAGQEFGLALCQP